MRRAGFFPAAFFKAASAGATPGGAGYATIRRAQESLSFGAFRLYGKRRRAEAAPSDRCFFRKNARAHTFFLSSPFSTDTKDVCPGGETGIRKGLKIPRPQGLAGSSPAPGTISIFFESKAVFLHGFSFFYKRFLKNPHVPYACTDGVNLFSESQGLSFTSMYDKEYREQGMFLLQGGCMKRCPVRQ